MSNPWLADSAAPMSRRRIGAEIGIVLGVSLGLSAVQSMIVIVDLLTRDKTLSQQTATLNRSLSDRQVFDLLYHLLGIISDLVPVALVCYLLWNFARPHFARLGLTFERPGRDAGWGVVLALAVGIPGLAFYFLGRALGISVSVVPSALDDYWWTVPVLLLTALRAALQEEVIIIGYLYQRLGMLGWGRWTIIGSTALLRGSYHLYQGFGGFVANAAMGVLFGWLYTKYGRLLPLIVTHFLLDAAVFVGYAWAYATFPTLFGA